MYTGVFNLRFSKAGFFNLITNDVYVCLLSCFSHVWLCDSMDHSPPISSVHRILQTRILEWGPISFSRASSVLRGETRVSYISCIGRQILYQLAPPAAAKSLQSCPTLCDPINGSPPGSAVPGILQARTLEGVAISFSSARKWKVKVKSLSRVRPFATPWTAAYQAPPSMGGQARLLEWVAAPPRKPHLLLIFWTKQLFVLGVALCIVGILGDIPGLYSLHVGIPPHLWQSNVSPDIAKCLWCVGAKLHPTKSIAIMTSDIGHLFMGLFALDIPS